VGWWGRVGDVAREKTYALPHKADSYQRVSMADVGAFAAGSDNPDRDLGSLVWMG